MVPVFRVHFETKSSNAMRLWGNPPPGALKFQGVRLRPAPEFAGDHTARVTPVPIPNTEVKPRWADGTARESVWERR